MMVMCGEGVSTPCKFTRLSSPQDQDERKKNKKKTLACRRNPSTSHLNHFISSRALILSAVAIDTIEANPPHQEPGCCPTSYPDCVRCVSAQPGPKPGDSFSGAVSRCPAHEEGTFHPEFPPCSPGFIITDGEPPQDPRVPGCSVFPIPESVLGVTSQAGKPQRRSD